MAWAAEDVQVAIKWPPSIARSHKLHTGLLHVAEVAAEAPYLALMVRHQQILNVVHLAMTTAKVISSAHTVPTTLQLGHDQDLHDKTALETQDPKASATPSVDQVGATTMGVSASASMAATSERLDLVATIVQVDEMNPVMLRIVGEVATEADRRGMGRLEMMARACRLAGSILVMKEAGLVDMELLMAVVVGVLLVRASGLDVAEVLGSMSVCEMKEMALCVSGEAGFAEIVGRIGQIISWLCTLYGELNWRHLDASGCGAQCICTVCGRLPSKNI
jgi:hypothetical protein